MTSDPQSIDPSGSRGSGAHGSGPLPAAVRQRLRKVFEHAQRCLEKDDFDYANQLFTQCVSEDPGNIVYLQNFFSNLQKKYGDNKKGAKLAGLKIKSHRSALTRAAGKGDWKPAFQSGCAALALNPWDIPTLLALAEACGELGIRESQLTMLRWALNVEPKDYTVNREAALALQRMGQFDQAIACWTRVEQAKPHDEEALRAISMLSVEKTIHEGGYDPELLKGDQAGDHVHQTSVAKISKSGCSKNIDSDEEETPFSPEQRLQSAIQKDPTKVENYMRLADILLHDHRFNDAEKLLGVGQNAAGGGDLQVLHRLEDVQLRRAAHQLAVAEQRCQQEPTDEAKALAAKFRDQSNQVELEIYATRVDRDPSNVRLRFEWGLRLKRAGKLREAITSLQAARSDPKQKSLVLVELGECFQKIEQYKLALSNYEQAIEACEEPDSETRRLALYRAGVLSTGLRELDRAERHLSDLAGLDYGYRDVADRLDKIAALRDSS